MLFCLRAYQRLHDSITENVKNVITKMTLCSSLPKRPRLDSSNVLPSCSAQTIPTSTVSPDVAVRVGYTQPKTYTLTPRRKRLGKAVTRKCQLGIATETMKNPITRKKILLLVGREVQKEVRNMTADSTHSILGREAWKEFEWDTLLEELQINAPVLLSILQAATRTRAPRSNTKSVIGTRAAILLKHRSPKMSLLQKVISLVLYSGHTSNQVYNDFKSYINYFD